MKTPIDLFQLELILARGLLLKNDKYRFRN